MTEEIVFDGDYYVSSKRATFRITVNDNIITYSAAIAKRFVGQHIEVLLNNFTVDKIERLEK